jgi:hypothetical protein
MFMVISSCMIIAITEITEIGSVLIRSEQRTEDRKRCARCISMRKVGGEHIRSERGNWADNSQLSIVFNLMSADMTKALIHSDTF